MFLTVFFAYFHTENTVRNITKFDQIDQLDQLELSKKLPFPEGFTMNFGPGVPECTEKIRFVPSKFQLLKPKQFK